MKCHKPMKELRGTQLYRGTGTCQMSLNTEETLFSPLPTYLSSVLNLRASDFFVFSSFSLSHTHCLIFLIPIPFLPMPGPPRLLLLFFPQPIKIHKTGKLYTIRMDVVQIQECRSYQGQFFLVQSPL